MKINNKGYASTIIMFSILTLFLISMLMLVKTMNNSSALNKKITEKQFGKETETEKKNG